MKHLNTYITEYIVNKKLDKPIDSEDHYNYYPKTKDELINIIKTLLDKGETNLNYIDISKITDMSNLFDSGNYNKPLNNIDISKWDVSNVKNMQFMFDGYEKFNCDLSKWDVSNVENMSYAFCDCSNFKGKGIENWTVSKVENMKGIFSWCINFNCDLSGWDVSNVNNMSFMFDNCKNFNCDLSNWDVSKVTNMKYMFQNCENFKAEGLDKWNIGKVKHMDFMFDNCISMKNKPTWYKK